MNQTDPYGFPYPECAPPLIKDASDVRHVYNLASAIDSRVTELYTEASDEFIDPDGAKVLFTGPLVMDEEVPITFNVMQYDNTPGAVMATPEGIRIRQSGFYFIAGWIYTAASADLARVRIVVEGLGEILNEGIGVGAGTGCHMTGSLVLGLQAGQLIQQFVEVGTGAANVNAASLAAVRVTGA